MSRERRVYFWLYLLVFTLYAHRFAAWLLSERSLGAFDFSFSNKEVCYICLKSNELLYQSLLSYIQLNTFNTKIVGNAKCSVLITNWTRQTLWDMGGSGCESAIMSSGSFLFSHEESRCWHGANRREILSLDWPWVPKLYSVNKVIYDIIDENGVCFFFLQAKYYFQIDNLIIGLQFG